MSVAYHPAVRRDVRNILRHYDEISIQLGDAFWEELRAPEPWSKTSIERRTRRWSEERRADAFHNGQHVKPPLSLTSFVIRRSAP